MKLTFVPLFALWIFPVLGIEYSGCSDPNYTAYVNQRVSFYNRVDEERYGNARRALANTPVNKLNQVQQKKFLQANTVLAARFDQPETARNYIQQYENLRNALPVSQQSGDALHQINIAKGWLALRDADDKSAIHFLIESTKVKGSPLLSSFGPDMTMVRELYKRGKIQATLDYLTLSESFWKSDSAKDNRAVWRTLIAHNCPIQFQSSDNISIQELGLK